MQEELKDDPKYVDIDRKFDIERPDGSWNVHIAPLAVLETLSVKLRQPDSDRTNFLLDWHGVISNPRLGRLHMYPGEDTDSAYEIKLQRMQRWAEAIGIYNSMMTEETSDTLSKEKVKEMIATGKIPRVDTVVLATGREGLKKLFTGFGFRPGLGEPFIADWKRLTELARSGEFIEAWKKQKSR